MTLAERIHARMIRDAATRRRLSAIPPAAIEDVLRLGLAALVEFVPMETHAADLTDIDWAACEGCGHLIDPASPEGAVYGGEDGIWLCDACRVEGAPETPETGDATPPSPVSHRCDAEGVTWSDDGQGFRKTNGSNEEG